MKRNIGKYALWVTLFLIAVVVFCLSLLQTAFTHFRFLACDRLAKLGNPLTL